MTDDDAGLIALLMEWDKLESKELAPRVALHIAGHIEAMKAVIRAKDEEIERLREALTQIARLRTDLSGDFSLGSKQSDIARAALGETE